LRSRSEAKTTKRIRLAGVWLRAAARSLKRNERFEPFVRPTSSSPVYSWLMSVAGTSCSIRVHRLSDWRAWENRQATALSMVNYAELTGNGSVWIWLTMRQNGSGKA
jgi:hypothetical protein